MGQAHGLPLRQARASIGPAYLDCCSSNRSLSMLFARSPVLHGGTCPISLTREISLSLTVLYLLSLLLSFGLNTLSLNLFKNSGLKGEIFFAPCRSN